jgi:hypothetical protein
LAKHSQEYIILLEEPVTLSELKAAFLNKIDKNRLVLMEYLLNSFSTVGMS